MGLKPPKGIVSATTDSVVGTLELVENGFVGFVGLGGFVTETGFTLSLCEEGLVVEVIGLLVGAVGFLVTEVLPIVGLFVAVLKLGFLIVVEVGGLLVVVVGLVVVAFLGGNLVETILVVV